MIANSELSNEMKTIKIEVSVCQFLKWSAKFPTKRTKPAAVWSTSHQAEDGLRSLPPTTCTGIPIPVQNLLKSIAELTLMCPTLSPKPQIIPWPAPVPSRSPFPAHLVDTSISSGSSSPSAGALREQTPAHTSPPCCSLSASL